MGEGEGGRVAEKADTGSNLNAWLWGFLGLKTEKGPLRVATMWAEAGLCEGPRGGLEHCWSIPLCRALGNTTTL